MITKDNIEKIVREKIGETDVFLVEVVVRPGNKILVHLDKPGKITISDCEAVSRFIEKQLDRDKEDFELEVSSPGIGRTFKVKQQYLNCIGRFVEVSAQNGLKVQGKLIDISDLSVIVEVEKKSDKKKKAKEYEKVNIPFNDVISTKEIINF